MNILMLTAYPPVLQMHGGGVRMFHNIRILAEKHSVRVISFVENDVEREMLRSVEEICELVIPVRRVPDFRPHWLSVLPFLVREFSTPEMYRMVDSEFRRKKVDVLQCEYLQMGQFHRRPALTVLSILETLSDNAFEAFQNATDPVERLRLFYRWMSVLRYETLMTRKFDRVVTMTETDATYLRSYSPEANIRAIPIGINPSEYAPSPEEPGRRPEVLFLGNFRHLPNVKAAEFLIERIAPLFPDLQFTISGSFAPDHVRSDGNVSFPGYVPDTRVLYHTPNTIVAAPLFSGRGQRVKLLEAFSMACPVITSSLGASGFPIMDGREALIADTADAFAAALRRLLSSEELRRDLGNNARKMIMRDFTWERIGEDLLKCVR
ncbi:MAG TPA: glycosyltransferase family 4 protein [Terriglobia bacterium]|nr:glycosyltransferase family 4 protein [Terriglobia bacterium]